MIDKSAIDFPISCRTLTKKALVWCALFAFQQSTTWKLFSNIVRKCEFLFTRYNCLYIKNYLRVLAKFLYRFLGDPKDYHAVVLKSRPKSAHFNKHHRRTFKYSFATVFRSWMNIFNISSLGFIYSCACFP